jgi:translation initiation factor 2D
MVSPPSLPVEASDLLEKHLKPASPEGTTLDVKKSSHKQIGKYLNAMRKAKVLEVKENKQVISVTKVDTSHKVFKALEEKFKGELAAFAASAATESEAKGAASAAMPPPKVSTVWKATHYTEPLFKASGRSKSDLYPWAEVASILASYTKAESLDLDGDQVKLNEDLITWLYRAAGAQKKDLTFPEQVDREELEEKLQDRMHEHTIIDVAGVGATTRKGTMVKIEVGLSRKGAHNVTRIANLEAYGLDPTALGDELKRKLNTQVYIEDMPGKNTKDKLLQLQGHVHQEFEAFLNERYGIIKSMLSVK